MVIQEAQLNTPEASKRERPRSRTLAAISAGTAAAALLAVIGVSSQRFTRCRLPSPGLRRGQQSHLAAISLFLVGSRQP